MTAIILALAASGGALALAVMPYGGPPDHLQAYAHSGAFFVISFLLAFGMPHRPWGGLATAFILGLVIEGAQIFVPGRSASLGDLAANLAGILAGGLFYGAVKLAAMRLRASSP